MQLLMFLACAHPKAAVPPGATTVTEVPAADPAWPAEEVQSRLQAVLDAGLPDPPAALAGFAQMFADGGDPHDDHGGSGSCPNAGNYSMTESFSGCHSKKNYVFAGISIFTPSQDNDSGFLLVGDCYIIDAQGYTFSCGGEVEFDPDQATSSFTGKVTGSWGYPPGKGWLALDPSMALWMAGDPSQLSLNGGYGPEGVAIYLDEVVLTPECLTGSVWIQDPAGSWYVLDYGDDCDTCGDLSYAGSPYGSACVDMKQAAMALRSAVGGG